MKCLQNRLIALFAIGLTYCVIGTHVTRAEPEDAGALLPAAESEDDLVNEGSSTLAGHGQTKTRARRDILIIMQGMLGR